MQMGLSPFLRTHAFLKGGHKKIIFFLQQHLDTSAAHLEIYMAMTRQDSSLERNALRSSLFEGKVDAHILEQQQEIKYLTVH